MTETGRRDTATVDWADIRRRLDDAREGLRDTVRVTPEQAREILNERARELARSPRRRSVAAEREVVLFALAEQRYALESRYVVEVARLQDIALLPGAEPPVIGVVGWRGRLLTVMDLRAILGLSPSSLGGSSRLIVLGDARPEFGIVADTVEEMTTVSDGAVRVPERGIQVNDRYVRGVALDAVLMLDAMELLRVDEDANNGESER
ncbi:MAG TPA: chemotaxis protein CheW [Gemmatimonadaceae bacterium]|nr:chemotaxis protein CheW [Gemmatimonadaceae bacterium]